MRHPKVSYIPFYIDYTTMKLRKMVLLNHKDFLSSMGAIAKTTCCHCEKRFSAFYVTGNFPTVWVSLEGGSSKSSRDNEELTFSLCLKNPKNQVKFFLSEPSWVHKGLTSHNHLLCCWTSKMANDTLALK